MLRSEPALLKELREIFIQSINSLGLICLENDIKHIILPDAFGSFEEIFFKQAYFSSKALSNADVVIDLGAHQGTFTVYSALSMKPHSILISVEPNPRTYAILLENIRLLKKIITQKELVIYTINKAVYTSKKLVKLKLTRWSEGSHLSTAGDINVQTITLEEIFSQFRHLNNPNILLKMDIEGTEYELFRDRESLKFIGMCEQIAIEPHGDPGQIMEELRRLGFKVKLREIILEPALYRKWLTYKPKYYTSIIATYRLIASLIAKPKIMILNAER